MPLSRSFYFHKEEKIMDGFHLVLPEYQSYAANSPAEIILPKAKIVLTIVEYPNNNFCLSGTFCKLHRYYSWRERV